MNNNTHVLIDEQGQAVLEGSEGEMLAALSDLRDLGLQSCYVALNDKLQNSWHWECMDWGD